MMTPDRLRAFFDAWNDHDVETIVSFFTPNGAYYASIGPDDAGTAFRGTDELRRGVAAFLGTYGDVRYSDLRIGMAGARAFASWTFRGLSPEGEPMTYRGLDLFEFEGRSDPRQGCVPQGALEADRRLNPGLGCRCLCAPVVTSGPSQTVPSGLRATVCTVRNCV